MRAALVAALLGLLLAALGALTTRWVRESVAVLVDILIAFPVLIIAMLISTVQGGSLWASTTNGAIVARVLKPDVARCNLSSLNGGITLSLAQGCSARTDASTERGMVRSDVPVQYTEGGNRRRHLRGDIGDGLTKVSMETTNGSIWIKRD